MKRWTIGVAAILVVMALFHFLSSPAHESVTPAISSPESIPPRSVRPDSPSALAPKIAQPLFPPTVVERIARVENKPAISTDGSRPPHYPPPKSVPFEKIGDFIVAYGDILLGKPKNSDFPSSGFIEAPAWRAWPGGIIPFSIHESLPDPQRVLGVIAYFNSVTSVRFVPYAGEVDSIVFLPLNGECLSYLGQSGGAQPIYLDERCGSHEITHELMHALGFIHEHSRRDRDHYLNVNWANIDPARIDQFDLVPAELEETVRDRPFDFHSVMLYAASAFALDPNRPTLASTGDTPIDPTKNGLSAEDLERLRRLYDK